MWDATELLHRCQWLQPRDDRNVDAFLPASVHEVKVLRIVEEHLRDHILCTGFHLLLEPMNVGLHIGCLVVLFRISGCANAEIHFLIVLHLIVEVDPAIQIHHMLQKFGGIGVTVRIWAEHAF